MNSEAVQRLGRRDPTLVGICLAHKQHTDAQLAELTDCLLAHPDVVKEVWLSSNRLTTSSNRLRGLYLFNNQAVDQTRIDAALVEALRVNPDRPVGSMWWLYSFGYTDVDFKRLREEASQLGHPSLQLLLALL